MALFKKNKTEDKESNKKTEVKKTEVKETANSIARGIAPQVLVRPHITEKAGILSGKNVYTFDVAVSSNKNLIKKAIEEIYKVKPLKVAVTQIKPTKKTLRGKSGFSSGGKKAYVYLKEGDKIEFI